MNPPWLNSELLLQTLYNCEWNAKSSLERAGGAPSTRAGPPRSIHGGSNLQSGGGWEGIASGGDPPRTWPHRPRHDEARRGIREFQKNRPTFYFDLGGYERNFSSPEISKKNRAHALSRLTYPLDPYGASPRSTARVAVKTGFSRDRAISHTTTIFTARPVCAQANHRCDHHQTSCFRALPCGTSVKITKSYYNYQPSLVTALMSTQSHGQ